MTSTDAALANILEAINELKNAVAKQSEELVELKTNLKKLSVDVESMPGSNAVAFASLIDEIEKKFTDLSVKITKSTKAIKSSVADQIVESAPKEAPKELTQTEIKKFLTDSLKVKGDTDLKKALKKAVPFFEECEKMDEVKDAKTDFKRAQKMTKLIYEKDKSRHAEINRIIAEVRINQIKNSGANAQVLVPEDETKEEKDARK